ncbi:mntA [Symbiodinium necroappetens]|uniref:MntA protein n=1 Tax=Symbiodinium necroappetens TaxID=1628268 RepID=A0A812LCH7_9DINO|nr:mntA [Symbiodinium necroappetens]
MKRVLECIAILITAATSAVASAQVSVVCTTGMIADVASEIAGDHATVTSLMGEGVDPHLYKPTRTDITAILRADVVFYNGLHLEGKMTDALTRAANAERVVIALGDALDHSTLLEDEETPGHPDPHVWMDPTAWAKIVPAIESALSEQDPENAGAYRERAREYAEELEAIDAYAERVLGTVPESGRVLVTAHDAFGYLGRRYNMEVVGIQGISTESEAGLRDIERLVDMLVTREIKAVFVESTVSDRNVKALIEGARARGHEVTIGGELYSDAMGAPGTYEGTYIGMIDHNVTTIARALGGDAPASGFSGKLAPR